jgi:hypothetical protein
MTLSPFYGINTKTLEAMKMKTLALGTSCVDVFPQK